jgi:hypothetical protein
VVSSYQTIGTADRPKELESDHDRMPWLEKKKKQEKPDFYEVTAGLG